MATHEKRFLGIIELKRKYQKNMLIGFISTGAFFVTSFGFASGWNKSIDKGIVQIEEKIPPDTLIVLPPLPSKPTRIEEIDTGQPPEPPEIGEIVSVPDPEAPENVEIPTQNELVSMIPETPEIDPIDYTSNANIEKIVRSLLPQHDEFVPYDEGPVAINKVNPVYPPLAWKARLEGTVWVKALIDKEGKVRDVIVINSSETDAGFEDAAIEGARKSLWKPAIANGRPVAAWVSFAVKFKLKK